MSGWFTLDHPVWVYVSIPIAAAAVGYLTKIVMIWMMFNPVEYKGFFEPWLGWQGQIPRRAAKMAAISVDTLQANLLKPEELIDQIDVDELVEAMQRPLEESLDEIVEAVAQEYQPGLWNALPGVAKRAVIARVRGSAPEVVRGLMNEFRDNLDQLFDLKHTVVSTLVEDKRTLSELFTKLGGDVFSFIRKAGLYFGFIIGVVQMLTLMATGIDLLVPIFGLLTGGLTDYVALQMVFRPQQPRRYLGFRWQGLFHKLRSQVAVDYAHVMAKDILTPQAMIKGLMTGPQSDRFFNLIMREVHSSVDSQVGVTRPLVMLAMGGRKYQQLKATVATLVVAHMPEQSEAIAAYAEHSLDIEAIIVEKMGGMTDDEYESTLRPIFRDDEWIVVALGAVLGFAVGELQLHLFLG